MSKGRLNQVIAVVKGTKARATRLLSDAHQKWNKDAIAGITKTYRPKRDDGDPLPSESKSIHLNVPAKIRDTMEQVGTFLDVVMTQEQGNTCAKASIELGGKVFLADMPVTTLLFLEHQLVDLHTFVSNLPTLPPDREWKFDENRDCHVTNPIESVRTQKVPKVIVKYAATKEHPAQTELFSEDATVGTWTTTYLSSAIPTQQRAMMLRRVEELQDAVKRAREVANSCEVDQLSHGCKILNHIFGDLLQSNEE